MIKTQGSIVVITLLFLSVLFCIFTIFHESNILQIKQFSAVKRQFLLFQMAEEKLTEMERMLEHQIITDKTEEIDNLKVNYHIEFLGKYMCVAIQNKAAQFFKINLIVENALNEKLHLISTVAYPTVEDSNCNSNKQTISAGRQSWYQLE